MERSTLAAAAVSESSAAVSSAVAAGSPAAAPSAPARKFGKFNLGMAAQLAARQSAGAGAPPAVEAAPAPAPESAPHEELPLEKSLLMSAWVGFKAKIPDRTRLHFHFDTPPEMRGDTVALKVASPLFYDDMLEIRPMLQTHLQNSLSRPSLRVEVELKEPEGGGRLLTPKEKLLDMAEKNPAVKDFCKRMNLKFG